MPFASGGSAIASGLSVITGRESMMSNTLMTLARASCPMVTIMVSVRTGPLIWAR